MTQSCGAGSLAPTTGPGHDLSRRPDLCEAGTPPRSGPVSSAQITGVHPPDHSSAFATSATLVPMAVCCGRALPQAAACGSRGAGNPLKRTSRRQTGSPEPDGQWHPAGVQPHQSAQPGRRTREYAPCRAAPIPGHDSPGAAAWDQGAVPVVSWKGRSHDWRRPAVQARDRCRMGQGRFSRRVWPAGTRPRCSQPVPRETHPGGCRRRSRPR